MAEELKLDKEMDSKNFNFSIFNFQFKIRRRRFPGGL